ncbi:MAG: 1-acyl-sn-glycerol-3-phosphate acyltransferase [Burkholderiales bacterium]|nr:1-acyl-sn-glycerol-3-phosphate acyltransferase [Burkholderiales bacterium]
MRNALHVLARWLFVVLLAWPVCLVVLGMNVRHRNRLPRDGPAIVTPNHNSHLDTLAMLTLFPLRRIARVRPVAAADYFLKTGLLGWFSLNFVGIIPIARKRGAADADPLAGCSEALARGEILIIFPEGTRGEPERMQELKSGVAVLASRFPDVPVVPVFMHGLGKSMPKGALVPVPFFVDVYVGQAMTWNADAGGDRRGFMARLSENMRLLGEKHERPEFE